MQTNKVDVFHFFLDTEIAAVDTYDTYALTLVQGLHAWSKTPSLGVVGLQACLGKRLIMEWGVHGKWVLFM